MKDISGLQHIQTQGFQFVDQLRLLNEKEGRFSKVYSHQVPPYSPLAKRCLIELMLEHLGG